MCTHSRIPYLVRRGRAKSEAETKYAAEVCSPCHTQGMLLPTLLDDERTALVPAVVHTVNHTAKTYSKT